MKQSIFCAVSRSAARLLLIHVFVLNKGREPSKKNNGTSDCCERCRFRLLFTVNSD